MWKRERDVIIVAPEMMPILKVAVLWNLIPDGMEEVFMCRDFGIVFVEKICVDAVSRHEVVMQPCLLCKCRSKPQASRGQKISPT